MVLTAYLYRLQAKATASEKMLGVFRRYSVYSWRWSGSESDGTRESVRTASIDFQGLKVNPGDRMRSSAKDKCPLRDANSPSVLRES